MAQLLVQRGMAVSGSAATDNVAVRGLRELGVRVDPGPWTGPRLRGAQLLVYPHGIGPAHPERLSAARTGAAQWSRLDWLARLAPGDLGLVVSGDRSASVASAMIAWTMLRAGLDPTVALTARAPQIGGWARLGRGPHFVIEDPHRGDELGALEPQVGILLGSHEGRSESGSARQEALLKLAASVSRNGLILAFEGEDGIDWLSHQSLARVEWLSLENPRGWWAADLKDELGRFRFRCYHRGRFVVEVRLAIPGRRHVLSALATVAACHHLGVSAAAIKEGLEEFTGLSRDFESRGSYRGVTLVDDEGWEALAVGETLALARQVFGRRRIWAVYGNGEECSAGNVHDFLSAFRFADEIVIFESPSAPNPAVAALVAAGVRARGAADLENVIAELDRDLRPGDVLVTLGTGDVGTIADAFIRRLPRDRQGG